jgi:hypothetical protein
MKVNNKGSIQRHEKTKMKTHFNLGKSLKKLFKGSLRGPGWDRQGYHGFGTNAECNGCAWFLHFYQTSFHYPKWLFPGAALNQ